MKKITVIGPTYIDHTIRVRGKLSLDGSTEVTEEYYDPGGTGLCYAIALSRLGYSVRLQTCIGNDEFSSKIRNHIRGSTITPSWHVKNSTTDHAYITIDGENHKSVASIRNLSNTWTPNKKDLSCVFSSRALVLTSFPNRTLAKIMKTISQTAKNKPYIMWAPHKQNCLQSAELINELKYINHITLSREEYSLLFSQIGSPLKYGVESMTITNGKNGSDLVTNSENKHFPVFRRVDHPLDTNGAGEAFGAAYLSTYLITNNKEIAVKTASVYSYLHIHRRSSDFPIHPAHELINYVKDLGTEGPKSLMLKSLL